MNAFESDDDVAIDSRLFRLFRLHRLLDPHGESVFSCNAYRSAVFAITSITLVASLVTLFHAVARAVRDNADSDVRMIHLFLLLYYTNYFRILMILIVYACKAHDAWNLFDVTRVDFLTAENCRKHSHVLHKYRGISTKITYYLSFFLIVSIVFWCAFPLILEKYNYSSETTYGIVDVKNRRKESIFNLQYPLSADVYNNFYFILYIIEIFILFEISFIYLFYTIYFVSFCCVFIAQYEIVTLAFENIGHDDNRKIQNDGGKFDYDLTFHGNITLYKN